MDRSNGFEGISQQFLRGRSGGIGVQEVQAWAATLPHGGSVLDLGCGSGLPLTSLLVRQGLETFGVDASPSLVAVFRQNLPGVPVLCEAVQTSRFFERTFDAVLAWGLVFLLSAEEQNRLMERFADLLVPGGRLLFTAPAQPVAWRDSLTDLPSRSLGAERYQSLLSRAGILVRRQYTDASENHYFDAVKL